ncbi:MAG: hypothetical protein HC927_05625 [Deltaproteobacteria bacterium]|nr:hypothetical protein [Deltaproteobacteria bacterium]
MEFPADQQPRWVFDPMQPHWTEIERQTSRAWVRAKQVLYAEQTLWIVAEVGQAFAGALDDEEPRSALYASRDAARVELPSFAELHLERIDYGVRKAGVKPGQEDCPIFHIVLLDDPDGANVEQRDAIIGKYQGAIESNAETETIALFVGTPLDRRKQQQLLLVAGGDRAGAKQLLALIEARFGIEVKADCRPRNIVRMIEHHRDHW